MTYNVIIGTCHVKSSRRPPSTTDPNFNKKTNKGKWSNSQNSKKSPKHVTYDVIIGSCYVRSPGRAPSTTDPNFEGKLEM